MVSFFADKTCNGIHLIIIHYKFIQRENACSTDVLENLRHTFNIQKVCTLTFIVVIYMHMPCMINRIWGLKQHTLPVNGHA